MSERCPFDRPQPPPGDKPCPACGATASEMCPRRVAGMVIDQTETIPSLQADRDRLAAENARLREALRKALSYIREQLDMGLVSRCPDDCDPEEDFKELEVLIEYALLEKLDD